MPKLSRMILPAFLAACAAFAAPAGTAPSSQATVAEFVRDPIAWYDASRARDALRLAPAALSDPGTGAAERRAVLLTVGAIHFSQGRVGQARVAFHQILASEPWAEAEWEAMPRPAWALYSRMRDSAVTANLAGLTRDGRLKPSVRTIAIGDIEDNSLVKGSYDLGGFARGLTHVLGNDLRQGIDLKVVERQRLDLLRQETGVSRENAGADPAFRVKVGQLYGAQSFLFGQIMQTEKDRVRLDLRWVDTATGEVLLAEGAEGRVGSSADLFALEKKVLLELLAPRMQELLEGSGGGKVEPQLREFLERKRTTIPSGNRYAQYVREVGQALASEDAGKDDAALAAWSRAAKILPADKAAGARAATLATQARLRKG